MDAYLTRRELFDDEYYEEQEGKAFIEDYTIHSKEPTLTDQGFWESEGKYAVDFDEMQIECLGLPKLKPGECKEVEINIKVLENA
jgi:hypothetical protein